MPQPPLRHPTVQEQQALHRKPLQTLISRLVTQTAAQTQIQMTMTRLVMTMSMSTMTRRKQQLPQQLQLPRPVHQLPAPFSRSQMTPRHMVHHMAQVQEMMLEHLHMEAMAVLHIINMVVTAAAAMERLHNRRPHQEIPLPMVLHQRPPMAGVTIRPLEDPNEPMEEQKPHLPMVEPGDRRLNNQPH